MTIEAQLWRCYHARVSNDVACVSERLRVALDLHSAGVRLQRQKLRREHPEADDKAIDVLIRRWLQTRPGATHGDIEDAFARVVEVE